MENAKRYSIRRAGDVYEIRRDDVTVGMRGTHLDAERLLIAMAAEDDRNERASEHRRK